MDELSNRFTAGEGEMILCSWLCDVCIFRRCDNEEKCVKYPAGKPEDIHKNDFYCQYFSSMELPF